MVRKIPPGSVLTYGRVADLAGLYGKPRLVGYALFRVEIDSDVPWQRVVNAKGEISYSVARHGGDYLQKALLEQEEIEFIKGDRIDLKKYLWQPNLPESRRLEIAATGSKSACADSDVSEPTQVVETAYLLNRLKCFSRAPPVK